METLVAFSKYDIAHVTQLTTNQKSFWCFYTKRDGTQEWDEREFYSRAEAEDAAKESGFQVETSFKTCSPATNPHA